MNDWKNIWDKRVLNTEYTSTLSKLISVDGFDTGYGTIIEKDWLEYVKNVSKKLKLTNVDSIFEVGCGAGAFLYHFSQNNHDVGGLDYSQKLINIAKEHLKKTDLFVDEAINLDIVKKYDFVISNSVFFYFSSLSYAENVLIKMVQKATKGIAILEVNDLDKKQESMDIRKGYLSEKEYSIRYKGLEHLYYSKQWFINLASRLDLQIIIEQQSINNYKNNMYRFNVFLFKGTK